MTQQEALDMLKLGHNVFLTGPAGSGKTYLLNQYISYLKEHKVGVGITASTGIAATHMGGVTIHSFTGMGIKDVLSPKDLDDLSKRPYLRERFRKTKVLIIDEISMLHAHRLDLVDEVCRKFKGLDYPFGGMQVILCGDFFQLPPVTKNKPVAPPEREVDRFGDPQSVSQVPMPMRDTHDTEFVIHADSWKRMNIKICYLEEQHRQDDRVLLSILNDIRNNEVSEVTVEYLSERLNAEVKGYVKPTRLFTHNADVDAINMKHLKELTTEEKIYNMSWSGSFGVIETLKKSCLAPETLVLKKGAQVMFVKNNYDIGYVNGTLGEVIGFDKDNFPIVRTFDGNEFVVGHSSWEVKDEALSTTDKVVASITQLPLRLAWAITVHKSQGMSLDAAEIDLSRSFTPGMGYVALSRVRSLSGLRLMGMNQMALLVHPQVSTMDETFLEQSNENVLYLMNLGKEKKEKMQDDYLAFLKGKPSQ